MIGALARPLSAVARARVAADLAARLRFQRTLRRWPAPLRAAPNAVPFVSLYEQGALRGCFGDHEGPPGERLARAFLRATSDARFPPIRDRSVVAGECVYMHSTFTTNRAGALARLEVGTHGVGLAPPAGAPVVLLPAVARDEGFDAAGMLRALEAKASRSLDEGELFLFEVSRIVARGGRDARVEETSARAARSTRATSADYADAWLERLVQPDGAIVFAIDPRARSFTAVGELHHARAAMVLRALGDRAPRRARARMEGEARAALRGDPIAGWPTEPAAVAGTLAHLILAGIDLSAELRALVGRSRSSPIDPWFAGQVAFALGDATPPELLRVLADDLRAHPWAPWTALAARRRGDRALLARAVRPLIRSLREDGPHVGGCTATAIPELALTALTIEALAGLPDREARTAVARARRFLERWQLRPGNIPAALDPALAMGAFPASPITPLLRCDVVAHVRLALG